MKPGLELSQEQVVFFLGGGEGGGGAWSKCSDTSTLQLLVKACWLWCSADCVKTFKLQNSF